MLSVDTSMTLLLLELPLLLSPSRESADVCMTSAAAAILLLSSKLSALVSMTLAEAAEAAGASSESLSSSALVGVLSAPVLSVQDSAAAAAAAFFPPIMISCSGGGATTDASSALWNCSTLVCACLMISSIWNILSSKSSELSSSSPSPSDSVSPLSVASDTCDSWPSSISLSTSSCSLATSSVREASSQAVSRLSNSLSEAKESMETASAFADLFCWCCPLLPAFFLGAALMGPASRESWEPLDPTLLLPASSFSSFSNSCREDMLVESSPVLATNFLPEENSPAWLSDFLSFWISLSWSPPSSSSAIWSSGWL